MTAAAGVPMRKAIDNLGGWLMVNTAHALKLAALAHIPNTAARTADVTPTDMRNPATRNATAAVTVVDAKVARGCGQAVAAAYRSRAPAVPPTISAAVWVAAGRCRPGTCKGYSLPRTRCHPKLSA